MVEASTIRQGVFNALRSLIIANKPTYTYNGTVYTYDVVAEYPKDNPTFPCIVLNKANITMPLITLDASTGDYEIEVSLELFAKEAHGKKAIDIGQDGLHSIFVGNISSFISTDGLIPTEDFWTDSGNSIFEDRNQVINTATSTIRFKLK